MTFKFEPSAFGAYRLAMLEKEQELIDKYMTRTFTYKDALKELLPPHYFYKGDKENKKNSKKDN